MLYLADRQQSILAWLERLGGGNTIAALRSLQSEAATIAWNEITVQSEVAGGIAARAGLRKLPAADERTLDEWDKAAQAITPLCRLRGPVELDSYLSRLSPEQRDAWYATTRKHAATPAALVDLAMYWADGKRNLLEIADLVEMETGKHDVELLVHYVRLLRELDLLA